MSTGFDWQMDEDGDEPPEFRSGRWPVTSLFMIAAVIVLSIVAFSIWGIGREREARRTELLQATIQDLLDLLHQAYLDGDGELFFANQAGDPAWLSAQLQPQNQLVYLNGPRATRVEQFGNDVWANIEWQQDGDTFQRVAFFQWRRGRLIQIPEVNSYWGPVEASPEAFGRLLLHKVDQEWERPIVGFVAETMLELCGTNEDVACRDNSKPFDLIIAPDFATTAEPGQVRVPSPRLVGLDDKGQPSAIFWERLRQSLEAHLTPATIRFAAPDEFLQAYEDAAGAFSAAQPDIQVDIVALESLPEDPLEWPLDIDGAAMAPDERMITAGKVMDLTDFVNSDPAFNEGDFYEQIWQGGWWQERMWLLPQSADMRLLFYDRLAYEESGLAQPSLRWTWNEMNDDLAALATSPVSERFSAIFLDPSRDTLFSYAFNLDSDCPGQESIRCTRKLSSRAANATLQWYQSLLQSDAMTVDLSRLSPADRDHAVINLISPRKVIIWAEEPVLYEHHVLYQPVGVVSFPGSERFDGITPLWVQGSFISQTSRNPLAAWEWLKYLSYQSLARQKRLVPARPSVAVEQNYWANLPRPVGEAMRTAFPFARPVLIEEYGYFTWAQLATISTGELSPADAVQSMDRVQWFGRGIQ